MNRKPLILPVKWLPHTRVRLYEERSLLWITDQRAGIKTAIIATALLMIAAIIGGVLWTQYVQSLPIYERHRYTASVGWAIGLVAFSALGFLCLPVVVALKGHHRRFRVRVDVLDRMVLCERWWFGVKMPSRRADLAGAQWFVESRYVQHKVKVKANGGGAASVIATVLLMFLGPIGLIVGLFMNSSRSTNRNAVASGQWSGQALAVLNLTEHDEPVVCVTVNREDIAREFLLAWDRLTG